MYDFQSIYDNSPYYIQNLALNLYCLKLYKQRYGKKLLKIKKELNQSQYCSKKEIDEYQNHQLRKLIEYAYENVLYYKQLFKKNGLEPSDIMTKEDLQKIPSL